MSALHRFEQRLEQVVNGVFARAFRSAVQPMEIAARLQREMDNSAQILSRERRLAPNDFVIDLSPTDFDRLSGYGDTLSAELAQMLHEYADEQGYLFAGAVSLRFQRIDELTTGRFQVRSQASSDVVPAGDPATDTAIRAARVVLEVNGVRQPVEPPGLVLGRGSQADLRIDDPGVSRRHAELRVVPGPAGTQVSVVDLDSTNGTFLDGRRVGYAVVPDGSEIRIGGTTMRVSIGTAPNGAAAAGSPYWPPAGAKGPAFRPGEG